MSNNPGNEQFIDEVTAIMREADPLFEKTGGGTRHYVRDLLLPMMEERGLLIIRKDAAPQPIPTKEEREVEPVPDQREVPEGTMKWIEEQVNYFSVLAAKIAGKALAVDMYYKMQEEIPEKYKAKIHELDKQILKEREQAWESFEKREEQISALQSEIAAYQRTLEKAAESLPPSSRLRNEIKDVLKKYKSHS